MLINEIRPYLIGKLKSSHCFWSYEEDSISDVPDGILVELCMLHLDLDDINLLFQIFSYKKMKSLWLNNVVAQGEKYYNLNFFFAWYYFNAKQPRKYVKEMFTTVLHKRVAG